MVTRPRLFDLNLYYHIYNCGVERRDTFLSDRDYIRFLDVISFYEYDQKISYHQFQRLSNEAKRIYAELNPKGSTNQRVKLISYCLMPNHFHFVLKLAKEGGITRFISDISNSYTRYFNIKNERIGSLFQGTYKSKEIPTEESLLQVTRYIHLNPIMSTKTNPDGSLSKPENYPFSSYSEWINPKGSTLLDQEEVSKCVGYVGRKQSYKEFVESKLDKDVALGIENLVIEQYLTQSNPKG